MTLQKPPRKGGLARLVAATGYSLAGLHRLWREPAFRQEVLGGGASLAVLTVSGASFQQVVVMMILLLALLTVEALNTAIEVLVDHLSPEWSAFGKEAKDIGSAAVFLLVAANALWFLSSFVLTVSGQG